MKGKNFFQRNHSIKVKNISVEIARMLNFSNREIIAVSIAALLHDIGIVAIPDKILHHHEHWDGTGYPYGLKGKKIPVSSRIILYADAIDVMLSERPYRKNGF